MSVQELVPISEFRASEAHPAECTNYKRFETCVSIYLMKDSKNKTQKTVRSKFFVLLALLVPLALVIVLFFNNKGVENVKRVYYGHVVREAYHKEYAQLSPALEGLGLNEDKGIKSACENEEIATDGINVEEVLFCGLESDNYVEINDSNKAQVLSAAKQLDNLTKQYDGKLQTNIDTTFGKYISDIADGVDYNPDFGATFVRGNYLCQVHMNVAFSKPKTPAYSIKFGCNAPRITAEDNYLAPPCIADCDEQV